MKMFIDGWMDRVDGDAEKSKADMTDGQNVEEEREMDRVMEEERWRAAAFRKPVMSSVTVKETQTHPPMRKHSCSPLHTRSHWKECTFVLHP